MEFKLKKQYQPFIGFEFDGVYSDSLNIKRVSSSNRYSLFLRGNEQVFTGSAAKIGVNYQGTNETVKNFHLDIAFDKMTEENFKKIQVLFQADKEGWLILDEEPYKKIWVKCNGTNTLKWLCFMENGQRVYKGEGALDFINYTGFWTWVSPYIGDYYDLQGKNYKFEKKEFENYFEYFSKTNLYFSADGYDFNKDVTFSSNKTKYCFISPSTYGRSYPIFYIYLTSEGRKLIKRFNFIRSNVDAPIRCYIDNVQDNYLRFDLHRKTVYGGTLDSNNNFIYSGNDYSRYLNYSKMGEELKDIFFESNILTKNTEIVVRNNYIDGYSSSDYNYKYRIFFQFCDADGQPGVVASYWNIIKVEYENLF